MEILDPLVELTNVGFPSLRFSLILLGSVPHGEASTLRSDAFLLKTKEVEYLRARASEKTPFQVLGTNSHSMCVERIKKNVCLNLRT